jgi:uncharacterized protein (TIGR02246 family)
MRVTAEGVMSNDEDAIRELVATWMAASQAGDTDTVLSLMADDVIFLTPGRPPMGGKAAFAESQAGLRAFDLEATSDIQEIQVTGDWAYMRTVLTVIVTPKAGGPPVRRAGDTLSILRKQDGRWMLFRDATLLAVVSA